MSRHLGRQQLQKNEGRTATSSRCWHWGPIALFAWACKSSPTAPPAPSASAAPSPVSPTADVRPSASTTAALSAPAVNVSAAPASASPEGSASAASGSARPTSSAPVAVLPTTAAGADVELPYRGTLGSERVVFRLTKVRALLEVRYFSEATGIDVPAKGRIRPDGSFVLKEKDSAAEWSGALHGDQLTGSRTLADSKLELSATRTPTASGPNRTPVSLATKRIPASCPDGGGHSAKYEYLEFVGAFAPEREAELNRELVPGRKELSCTSSEHTRMESRVLFNADGIVSIEQRRVVLNTFSVSSPEWVQRYRTYSIAAQRQLTTDEVFEGPILSRDAERVFRKHLDATRSVDPALVETEKSHAAVINLDNYSFAAEGTGVRFISGSAGSPWGGILIPYAELSELKYLTRTSALAFLAFREEKPH